jgi:hypothetical protein
MSELQSILYHDANDEERSLDVSFVDNRLALTIQWWTGKGGRGAIRAESFMLDADQAYYLAKDILHRFPDPMIIEDNLLAIGTI